MESVKYPHHLIWTTIPIISWIIPFIGHMGITDSKGNIYDFSGNYTIQKNNFAFGDPIRVYQLPSTYNQPEYSLDDQIIFISSKYRQKQHSFITNNCHHYCLDCLQSNDSIVTLTAKVMLYGVYLDGWKSRLHHWGPFIIIWLLLSAIIISMILLL